jgi:hypothetical protein
VTTTIEQLVAKDLSNLVAVGKWAEDIQLYGSFAARRPDLGKMVTRPCGHRRRQASGPCCNVTYEWVKKGTDEIVNHENEKPFGKKLLKRIHHKSHGQSRKNKLRTLTLRFMEDENLVKAAAEEMHVALPDKAAIPPFAEKYRNWKEDKEQKCLRRQQDISRRINAGLLIGGSR